MFSFWGLKAASFLVEGAAGGGILLVRSLQSLDFGVLCYAFVAAWSSDTIAVVVGVWL